MPAAGRDAGDAYSKQAELRVKLGETSSAAQAYLEAAKAYQRVDTSSMPLNLGPQPEYFSKPRMLFMQLQRLCRVPSKLYSFSFSGALAQLKPACFSCSQLQLSSIIWSPLLKGMNIVLTAELATLMILHVSYVCICIYMLYQPLPESCLVVLV